MICLGYLSTFLLLCGAKDNRTYQEVASGFVVKHNNNSLTTRNLPNCFASIQNLAQDRLKWMMVSQACYSATDGRRYSRVYPPYFTYTERRFQLPSHDTRAITMSDSQIDDSTPPRKRIAVAVRTSPYCLATFNPSTATNYSCDHINAPITLTVSDTSV